MWRWKKSTNTFFYHMSNGTHKYFYCTAKWKKYFRFHQKMRIHAIHCWIHSKGMFLWIWDRKEFQCWNWQLSENVENSRKILRSINIFLLWNNILSYLWIYMFFCYQQNIFAELYHSSIMNHLKDKRRAIRQLWEWWWSVKNFSHRSLCQREHEMSIINEQDFIKYMTRDETSTVYCGNSSWTVV